MQSYDTEERRGHYLDWRHDGLEVLGLVVARGDAKSYAAGPICGLRDLAQPAFLSLPTRPGRLPRRPPQLCSSRPTSRL